MTSFKLQNHEFQIQFRYLSIAIYIDCVNRELCFCILHSFINVCQKRQICRFGVLPVNDKNVVLALKGLSIVLHVEAFLIYIHLLNGEYRCKGFDSKRITDFSTTGSAGLKRRDNGRKHFRPH